ncbi:hypothetical protein LCGC14_2746290, partial [marine sediment metagenome]
MTIKTLNSLSLPVENDVLLTVPQFTDWAKLTEKNSKLVTQSRKELLRAAINYTKTTIDMPCPTEDLRCTVVTGHQPEWHHCGIAAKSIVSYHLAQKLGAYCIHLILDHDTGSSKLRMPVIQKNKWAIKEFELENDCDKLPFEFRSSAQLDQILTFVDACVADHKYFCQSAWQEIRAKLTIGRFRNLADTIMFLQAKVYAKMGIDMLYLPVSKMSSTKVFLHFAASIIKDAEFFVNIYNKATGNSRNNDGYKPRILKIDSINKTFELPFWVVSSHGKRMPLFVNINRTETILLADDREFLRGDLGNIDLSCFEIKEALQRHGWYLRPKALTLTLFVRMYFADWFVHGIGGAKYEPIVDCILKEYFGI